MHCKNCGIEVKETKDKFCDNCGSALTKVTFEDYELEMSTNTVEDDDPYQPPPPPLPRTIPIITSIYSLFSYIWHRTNV